MKALVIGNCNSIFVKQYIETVYTRDDTVVLLAESTVDENYQTFYNSINVKIEPLFTGSLSFIRRIPVIRSVLSCRFWVKRIIKLYGHFDVVHIHALNKAHGLMGQLMRPYSDRLVISIWGSELLSEKGNKSAQLRKYYEMADCITLTNDKMQRAFESEFGDAMSSKICRCGFAMGIIDVIDNLQSTATRRDVFSSLGMEDDRKLNVYIGHNGREVQRHEELTKEIALLPDEIKKEINLVYTMTYGVPSPQYLENLRMRASQTGCTSTFIVGFQSEENVARIRLACDIMLHAQLADAASASIRECMYAGAIVFNGRWLPYEEIPDYHNRVIEYDEISDIHRLLSDVILNYQNYALKYSINKFNKDMVQSKVETINNWKIALGISKK